MKYVGNLLPFVFRKSKSISVMAQTVVYKQNIEIDDAQRHVVDLMTKGKYKGQAQVVSERIKELYGDKIWIEDGSNGNVIIVGNASPYRRIMGVNKGKAFIALPMSRTTVGIDFVVNMPEDLKDRESEIIAWLNSVVLAGVGFEVKIV